MDSDEFTSYPDGKRLSLSCSKVLVHGSQKFSGRILGSRIDRLALVSTQAMTEIGLSYLKGKDVDGNIRLKNM